MPGTAASFPEEKDLMEEATRLGGTWVGSLAVVEEGRGCRLKVEIGETGAARVVEEELAAVGLGMSNLVEAG